MKRVVVETPFAHKQDDEVARDRIWKYLRAALRDCLMRGEAPFASHALYTQPGVLDDWIPEQRAHGINAGFEWGDLAEVRVVYTDLGVSGGMQKGIDRSKQQDQLVELRSIPNWDAL